MAFPILSIFQLGYLITYIFKIMFYSTFWYYYKRAPFRCIGPCLRMYFYFAINDIKEFVKIGMGMRPRAVL